MQVMSCEKDLLTKINDKIMNNLVLFNNNLKKKIVLV